MRCCRSRVAFGQVEGRIGGLVALLCSSRCSQGELGQEGVQKSCLWWPFREQGRKDRTAASTGGFCREDSGLLKDASSL